MGKRKPKLTKPARRNPRPQRMKQTVIPGTETAEQTEVREAADELLELRDDQRELKKHIDEALERVRAVMSKHGMKTYRDPATRLEVDVEDRDPKVRVRRARPRRGKIKDRLRDAIEQIVTPAQEIAGRPHDEQNAIVQMVATGEAQDVREAEQRLDAERREAIAAE